MSALADSISASMKKINALEETDVYGVQLMQQLNILDLAYGPNKSRELSDLLPDTSILLLSREIEFGRYVPFQTSDGKRWPTVQPGVGGYVRRDYLGEVLSVDVVDVDQLGKEYSWWLKPGITDNPLVYWDKLSKDENLKNITTSVKPHQVIVVKFNKEGLFALQYTPQGLRKILEGVDNEVPVGPEHIISLTTDEILSQINEIERHTINVTKIYDPKDPAKGRPFEKRKLMETGIAPYLDKMGLLKKAS